MQAESQRNPTESQQGVDLSVLDDTDTQKVLADLDIRLEHDLGKDLRQREVVELMLSDDRPVFSVYQIQQQLESDVSDKTVRRRLRELVELGVVNRYQLSGNDLYYINDQRSSHAVPGDLYDIERPDNASFWDLFLLRRPGAFNWMFNSSMIMVLYLIIIGAANDFLGNPVAVSGQNEFVTAALLVILTVMMVVLFKTLSSVVRDHIFDV